MARTGRRQDRDLGAVAFLGLDRLGSRLAGAVARQGFGTTVWHAGNPAAPLMAVGVSSEASAARAARHADVVVLSLGTGEAVREVLFGGEDPVAGQLRPDAVVIDTTPTSPRHARAIAARLDQQGIRSVEAPVLGSLPVAGEGPLTTLTGGDPSVVEAVLPVMATWSGPGRVVHMGGVGTANAARLVVMTGVGIAAEAIGEALRLGQDLLLDRTRLIEAMRAGPFAALVTDAERLLLTGDSSGGGFSVDMLLADLSQALYESSSALPATEAAYLQARLASSVGRGGHGFIEIALRRENPRDDPRDTTAEVAGQPLM